MPVLSQSDRNLWEENGYVVVHNAVPSANIEAAKHAIYEFSEMDPDDPESWYPDPPRDSIMVEIYQHQALWDNRQHPRVHQAFSEILGVKELWVSLDRTSINPPERHDFQLYGGLHFDIALKLPITLGVQGILYLTDTPADHGALQCVPGFHKRVEEWVESLPPGADPNEQDLAAFGPTPVPGCAGDLIIWHSALPHWASPNRGTHPRVAQYITMSPAREDDQEDRQGRIDSWRNLLTGTSPTPRGWGKGKEHKSGHPGELTSLGRRLLGLDLWPSS
jgi:hypothetical protein